MIQRIGVRFEKDLRKWFEDQPEKYSYVDNLSLRAQNKDVWNV